LAAAAAAAQVYFDTTWLLGVVLPVAVAAPPATSAKLFEVLPGNGSSVQRRSISGLGTTAHRTFGCRARRV